MKSLIKNYEDLVKAFTQIKSKGFSKEYLIYTEPFSKKRSKNQLRAYWRLIHIVKNYMNNDCGNEFTSEQISDWFKIISGFYTDFEGIYLPKSISDKSKCTKEDMKNLINRIINFGVENDIEDCFITDSEWKEILNDYKD
jgi:hypothetical protein